MNPAGLPLRKGLKRVGCRDREGLEGRDPPSCFNMLMREAQMRAITAALCEVPWVAAVSVPAWRLLRAGETLRSLSYPPWQSIPWAGGGCGPHRDLRPKLLQPMSFGEHRTLATGWVLNSIGGAIHRKDICSLTGWALCPHKLPSLASGVLSKLKRFKGASQCLVVD